MIRGCNPLRYLMTADPVQVRVTEVSRIRGPPSEYVPGVRRSIPLGAASPWASRNVSYGYTHRPSPPAEAFEST